MNPSYLSMRKEAVERNAGRFQKTAAVLVAALICAIVAGCAAAPRSYRTSAAVAPSGEPHIYTVDFSISHVGEDGETRVLSSPRISVKAGQEGQIMICDEDGRNGYSCTALVTEREDGIEAVTRITVKEEGEEELCNSQSMIVKG